VAPSDGQRQGPRATHVIAPRSSNYDILTRRQIEVIELIAHADTNKQIGARITLSEGTVKSRVHAILRKVKAANRGEAVFHYIRMSGDL